MSAPIGRPSRPDDDRVSTTVRTPRELLERLDREAEDRDVSRNWLVNKLIERGLDNLEALP